MPRSAMPRWKGKLCLRSGKAVYNQSLVAMFINDIGEEATERMVRAWIGNLAAEPFSNDTLMLKAIAAGPVRRRHHEQLLPRPAAARAEGLPGADLLGRPGGQGHARQHLRRRRHEAREEPRRGDPLPRMARLPAIQQRFAAVNFEFPANAGVDPLPEVKAWGPFKPNTVNVGLIGKTQPAAVMLIDRAGWR